MNWKLFKIKARRTAFPLLGVVGFSALGTWAEVSGIRLSAPALGWVLSPDGTQAIEITGLAESPRTGRTFVLTAPGSRLWPSPDGRTAIIESGEALLLLSGGSEPRVLTGNARNLSVAWDRSSAGFAACQEGRCDVWNSQGEVAGSWEVAEQTKVIAHSATAGTLVTQADSAVWHAGFDRVRLDGVPTAAAFRPGTAELWILNSEGRLEGRDAQGRTVGQAELTAQAVGLAVSSDGNVFLAANAAGEAAATDLRSGVTRSFSFGTNISGLWTTAGALTVRLHDSLKRPVAFWNADTDLTGYMPAAESSDGLAIGEVIQ